MKILKGGFVEMENGKGEGLENKFLEYLENADDAFTQNPFMVLKLDGVKNMVNDFCKKNNLQNQRVFTDQSIGGIFNFCSEHFVSITLDDAKKFLDEYLSDGKKISFETLNSLMACMKPKTCELKELHNFIGTYVDQSKNHSELDEEIFFFRELDSVVNLKPEALDKSNVSAAKFFSDWQSKIIGISNITNDNYMSINYLAIKLLEFKAKTKQYSEIKDIQNDILSYIEKIVLLSKKQNKLPGNILGCYFNALLTASIGDKKYKQKVFDQDFIQCIKKKILGDDKKRSNCYQIMFLFNLLKFFYDLYNPKELPKENIFDGFYTFVFGVRNKKAIKKIVDNASDKIKRSIANHFLSFTHKYVDNHSKSFSDFCEIFGLKIKKSSAIYTSFRPTQLQQTTIQIIKDYLLDYYSLSQNEMEIKNINVQEKVYNAKICIENETYNLNSYNEQEKISCDINLLTYKKNSRAYEIFAAAAFLIFGFIPLIILKSIFDILFLPIKVIINIFHSAIIAFKRKEYLWMFLHILIDLLVGILFIAFSPIICLYNNFCGSKYLFHKSGTGQKLITFNNWYFYKEQSDFVIRYIFGFACLAKSEDSELKMEFKLTHNKRPSKESVILKLSDKILDKYAPDIALTNEYSPLSYLETIR